MNEWLNDDGIIVVCVVDWNNKYNIQYIFFMSSFFLVVTVVVEFAMPAGIFQWCSGCPSHLATFLPIH